MRRCLGFLSLLLFRPIHHGRINPQFSPRFDLGRRSGIGLLLLTFTALGYAQSSFRGAMTDVITILPGLFRARKDIVATNMTGLVYERIIGLWRLLHIRSSSWRL